MKEKIILVTGANGYLGERLCTFLAKDSSFRLRTLTRKNVFFHNNDPMFFSHFSDINSSHLKSVDYVIHCAGHAHDTKSLDENEDEYLNSNILFTKQLLKVSIESNIKKFIFISSVRVNSNKNKVFIKENDQYPPSSTYGKTKLLAEKMLIEELTNSNIPYSIIRPALVYGPRVKGNLNRMINLIQKGLFPPIPPCNNSKSLVHIDDLTYAIHFCIVNQNTDNNIFNITDEMSYSTYDIYKILSKSFSKKIPNWSVPKYFFEKFPIFFPMGKKIRKIFDNDSFSSEKIRSLGFKTQKNLTSINETDI